jgi:hypothetical protein
MHLSRLLSVCTAAVVLTAAALSQTHAATKTSPRPKPESPYAASETSGHARDYYLMHWGVDSMVVKAVPADQLVRFSYRVVDSSRAQALNVKEASPQLFDEKSKVSLVVPTMDKVGQLRQAGLPENGKTYWMVFSNKGNVVKRGHRVGIVIGQFHANGLAVE